MHITDEQRKRAEANRLAALAKRKAILESFNGGQQLQQQEQPPWTLFKCPKLSHELAPNPNSLAHSYSTIQKDPIRVADLPEKFRVRLEICSPDSFSASPIALRGFAFPGGEECLRRLTDCLSNSNKSFDVKEIPWGTLNVVERLSHSFVSERWMPCRPEHLSDDEVDDLMGKLPKSLLEALLPFQLDGVKFGLRRGGRCLIADEMGLGKTLQAIAIACCFMNEGSVLIVCPAILRFSWAEELERWVPFLLPSDIHLVFGHQNNPAHLKRCPKVVVISFTMLHRLRKSMLDRDWALLIVDESHHVRCTKKAEPGETKAVLDMAAKVKHIVLLSGTPSLSRPGLLGKNKYDFAKTYCNARFVKGVDGSVFQDFSKGTRLEELNVLLKQTVMIRRLKEHVMLQLPPKRRQILRVLLKRSDKIAAKAVVRQKTDDERTTSEDGSSKDLDDLDDGGNCHTSEPLSDQELGIAKLSAFREWLSIHPLFAESDSATNLDSDSSSHKMIVFAHHHKVLNRVQEFICEKGIGFVRIDGTTLARDRQSAVLSFRTSTEVKIAIIGITAGGVGLDFSSAQHVVFLELPQSPSLMLQAEDRAHRRGQKNAVNIYIFCAKDTADESHWRSLNRSLRRVSSTTDGNSKDKNEIVEVKEPAELSAQPLEFQNSILLKNTDPSETNHKFVDEVTPRYEENTNVEGSSAKTDSYLVEFFYLLCGWIHAHMCVKQAMVTCGVDANKGSVSEGKLGENVSESKTRNAGRESLFKLDEGKMLSPQVEGDETVEVNEGFSNPVDFLRFEVSQYTGRIHLYSCISGKDTRPRPLFENFRVEELEPLNSSAADNEKKTNLNSVKDNPVYRSAALAFSKEWNKLRPVEQKKLIGKPLQLPLTVELSYLNEGVNHKSGGVLKVGSRRRRTPLSEISQPLPPDAVWKKVHLRTGYGKKEKEYTQGWTLTDEPLCKLCQAPCKSSNAKAPEFFEDLFCNLGCYEEYRIRTSNRSLRQELFQLENGICANCQLDCHTLVEHIRPLSLAVRREYIEKVAPRIGSRKNLLDKLVKDPVEGNSWHADHIVPVYQGGGECMLENMRTLCVACHYDVTKAQCADRRLARAKAKKQLKAAMDSLKNAQNNEQTDTNIKDQGHLETRKNVLEDDFLVEVPGSAYSSGNNMDAGSERSITNKEIPLSTDST
ncbi:hypothetical protein TIFTF001_023365 [Ficus carica]|uniref:DNA annealing helicase and endonuclease ZRANB3 n=1 Tax=Ficus carica TaxID=3494 RepID=A0AA88DG74_FICCA|nr:hypothetical protein TIFTF001_023365 [Ficus carica]